MTWVVLAIALGFVILARVERAAATKIRSDANAALAQLDAAVARADELRALDKGVNNSRMVLLPAPFPLVAQASTTTQAACALYSWMTIRGEGRA